MLRIVTRRLAAVAVVMFAVSAAPAAAQDYKVIVNNDVATDVLSSAEVARIFLKQGQFPAGAKAVPVDLSKSSPVRASFSKNVIGRPVSAVETYWQQQIFSGKDTPPPSKSSEDDVVAFVKATPGGIGYVSAGTATTGVKVVTLK